MQISTRGRNTVPQGIQKERNVVGRHCAGEIGRNQGDTRKEQAQHQEPGCDGLVGRLRLQHLCQDHVRKAQSVVCIVTVSLEVRDAGGNYIPRDELHPWCRWRFPALNPWAFPDAP